MIEIPLRVGDSVDYAFDANSEIKPRVFNWMRTALGLVGIRVKRKFFRVTRGDGDNVSLSVYSA